VLIKQLYKSYKNISISNQILRVVSDFIINFFLLKYLGFLRNILLQKLISCTSISVNSIKIFLKDGNERLYLFNKVSFVIEKDLINWINTFKNKDTFYDIGSNVGMFSIYAAKKKINVFSFEPHYANLETFLYNIRLNNVQKNIISFPILLSDKIKVEKFFLRDLTSSAAKNEIAHKKSKYILGEKINFRSKNKSIQKNILKSALTINTFTNTLDNIIDKYNILRPTKVKIDVDGAELMILKGFKNNLQYVSEIMIEMYERDVNYFKCYNDFKYKNIDTAKINNDYFIGTKIEKNFIKNPYFNEIEKLLKIYKFFKKSTFGNNILYTKN
jgi:FkbM family methyltransferase